MQCESKNTFLLESRVRSMSFHNFRGARNPPPQNTCSRHLYNAKIMNKNALLKKIPSAPPDLLSIGKGLIPLFFSVQ